MRHKGQHRHEEPGDKRPIIIIPQTPRDQVDGKCKEEDAHSILHKIPSHPNQLGRKDEKNGGDNRSIFVTQPPEEKIDRKDGERR